MSNPRQAERSTAHPNRSPLIPKDFLRKSAWSVSSGNGNRWACKWPTGTQIAQGILAWKQAWQWICDYISHTLSQPSLGFHSCTFANSLFFCTSSELMPKTSAPTSLNLP